METCEIDGTTENIAVEQKLTLEKQLRIVGHIIAAVRLAVLPTKGLEKMSSEDLESRVSRLEKVLTDYSRELQLALEYMKPDAASSLTKSRMILEKIAIRVYVAEMGTEPRKPLLGEMLADNQFTRKIDRRIVSRMNSVRDMGNLGPHGEAVEARDAARVLDDLCEVLDWYMQRYSRSATETLKSSRQDNRALPRTQVWHWFISSTRSKILLAGAVICVILLGLSFTVGPFAKPRPHDPDLVGIEILPGGPEEVNNPDEDPNSR